MPVITIDAPKLTKEQKTELVKSFAEKASEVMGLPVEAMVYPYKGSWRRKCWCWEYTSV